LLRVLAAITFIPGTSTTFIVVAFVIGAFFSVSREYGMRIATKCVRTTQAARTKFAASIESFFWWRNRYGTCVAGLAVLGLTSFFIFFYHFFIMVFDY
jgi:K(+)-stimulated pyrophosphate-energized sodium pump